MPKKKSKEDLSEEPLLSDGSGKDDNDPEEAMPSRDREIEEGTIVRPYTPEIPCPSDELNRERADSI